MDIDNYIKKLNDPFAWKFITTIDLISKSKHTKAAFTTEQQYSLIQLLLNNSHCVTTLQLESFTLSYRVIKKLMLKGIKNIQLKDCLIEEIPNDVEKFHKASQLIWKLTFQNSIHLSLIKEKPKAHSTPTQHSDLVEAILEDSKKMNVSINQVRLSNFSIEPHTLRSISRKYYPHILTIPELTIKPTPVSKNCMSGSDDESETSDNSKKAIQPIYPSIFKGGRELAKKIRQLPTLRQTLSLENSANAGASTPNSPHTYPDTPTTPNRKEAEAAPVAGLAVEAIDNSLISLKKQT